MSNPNYLSNASEEERRKFTSKVEFVTGDITEIEADAIVCPSLPDLDVLYMGVAGAIMRKGGDAIFSEARSIGNVAKRKNPESKFPVPPCSAHLTNGGKLPKAKHVIHSVAVDYDGEDLMCSPEIVFKSAWNVLEIAHQNNLTSIAFPALGSGLYDVPLEDSLGSIFEASVRFLQSHPGTSVGKVKLVTFDSSVTKPSLIDELTADLWMRSLRQNNN